MIWALFRRLFSGLFVLALCMRCSTTLCAATIQWSGLTWDIKAGYELGPGPNDWSDSTDSVWVDPQGNLHLKVFRQYGRWLCAEIVSQDSFGYGNYEFRIETNTESYDPNLVAGLFTYADITGEVDIELSRFGDPENVNASYTVQPYDIPGNSTGFDLGLTGDYSTHSFDWTADQIDFQSLHGHNTTPPTPGHIINQWRYTGADIPAEGSEKVHINLWLVQGAAPTNGQSHEFIIHSFTFTPAEAVPEPTSIALLILGGATTLLRRK